ncbi:hypothetical protein TNIN_31071 [Trichonephila inaurata madagascariensis]|uniref:Uncharacterized protein n=1 Tax=Trichonephila inaurata madagascariensis TaxID=2747483 RepID=A0A8X6YMD1_9ARAC|nr:hypothetical protein TNIN_31071 [Trichonephila inaurata madagascariensis]
MITENINVADGLANGAAGKLSHIELDIQNRVLGVGSYFQTALVIKHEEKWLAMQMQKESVVSTVDLQQFLSTEIDRFILKEIIPIETSLHLDNSQIAWRAI